MLHREKTEMGAREEELIRIVREHEDPQKAVSIAIDIILKYLKQPLSSEEQVLVGRQESSGISR